jgi:histone H3/H4
MTKIPLSPVEKLMKAGGANRVSPGAVKILRNTLEEIVKEVSEKSFGLAKYAGRKTIQKEDVLLAIQ